MTTQRWKLSSSSPEQTEAIARELAQNLPAAAVTVGMTGRLGAGKTCFVRGLAGGMEIEPDEVASPTFVYLVEYGAEPNHLNHADLYRLEDTEPEHAWQVFESIGLFDALESETLTAVEWWEHYRGPSPTRLVTVEFVAEKADDRAIFFELNGPDLEATADWLARQEAAGKDGRASG